MLRSRLIVAVAVILAALLVGGGLLWQRWGEVSSPTVGEVPGRTRVFSTWEEFLSEKTDDHHKVVFIGLDGATWDLIDPMIEEGILPTFARLKREGAWGVLRSTSCFISPPAWVSMMTGYLPERSGVYSFGNWNAEDKRFSSLTTDDVLVPSVWDVSSLAGLRTAAVNIPVTFPAREVDGIMVSGLLTPVTLDQRRAFKLSCKELDPAGCPPGVPTSYSPVMSSGLDHHSNHFEFFICDTQDDNAVRYDKVCLQMRSMDEEGGYGPVTTHVIDLMRYSPWVKINFDTRDGRRKAWCRIGVLPTRDRMVFAARFSHILFAVDDTDKPFIYPEALADELAERFDYYFPSTYLDRELVNESARDAVKWATFFHEYEDWDLFLFVFTQTDNILHADGMSPLAKDVFATLDRFIGTLVDDLPSDCTLFIGSDHGFGRYIYKIDLNRALEGLGLLRYKDGDKVDFDNTVVFHNLWSLFFNETLLTRQELERRGIQCPPGKDPREVLVEGLEGLIRDYLRREHRVDFPLELEEFDPNSVGIPPDMAVHGTSGQYQVELWNLNKPRDAVVNRVEGEQSWAHAREGIYVVYGEGVRRGVNAGVFDVQDITPTMLYRLGLPVARDMDGRVMTGVFEPSIVEALELPVVEAYHRIPRAELAVEAKRDSLEKQLRNLGYIR